MRDDIENLHVKVVKKSIEADDIASFVFAPVDGKLLPPFSAGSHIWVKVPGGLTRQYSLCNDPVEQHRYRIAVLRETLSRGGSAAMHDEVNEGDIVSISRPHNHFPLRQADYSLLLAGGIGVTPLLCMAMQLHASGSDFVMHYCTRSAQRTAFLEEIAASEFASNVRFHFDAGGEDQKLNLDKLLEKPDAGTRIYVCGPKGFIDNVLDTARIKGWPEDLVHREYFGSAAVHDKLSDGSFQVEIASSGKIYSVAADQSITDALRVHGIDIPTSCEQGVCGTCVTRVIAGEPDHRDEYFTEEERKRGDQCTPCCSRSKSAILVLDL